MRIQGEFWAALFLMLACSLWLVWLVRAELSYACPSATKEGMETLDAAYAPPKELPMTKSTEPGQLSSFDPVNHFAPFEGPVGGPTPAPAPAPAMTTVDVLGVNLSSLPATTR